MANLADIPDHLLDPGMRNDFVNWLTDLPVDKSIRIELASAWTAITGKRLTPDQFTSIQE